jgi:hypothetical protein
MYSTKIARARLEPLGEGLWDLLADIDESAIERLNSLWMASSKNTQLASLGRAQLLEDAELTLDGEITYAALILLGSRKGLGRHLAQAETIFEYRSSDASIPAQQRQEYREVIPLASALLAIRGQERCLHVAQRSRQGNQ